MYVPYNVIKTIHEETHSAYPNARVVPHIPRPRRHPIRAVRRFLQARAASPQSAPASPEPAPAAPQPLPPLTLVAGELCEAEVRDRGTEAASTARAC
ncbi:hypothetical protein GCM10009743_09560 [Kribbella swartbergensis]